MDGAAGADGLAREGSDERQGRERGVLSARGVLSPDETKPQLWPFGTDTLGARAAMPITAAAAAAKTDEEYFDSKKSHQSFALLLAGSPTAKQLRVKTQVIIENSKKQSPISKTSTPYRLTTSMVVHVLHFQRACIIHLYITAEAVIG